MFRPQAVPFRVYSHGFKPDERQAEWIRLSGAAAKRASCGEGYYARLVATEPSEGDLEQVTKDIHRSGIENTRHQEILSRVLLAYSIRNQVVGYCQGMNFVCVTLIQHIDDEEMVFWVFACIIENILSADFYAKSPQLIGFHVDNNVLKELVTQQMTHILCRALKSSFEPEEMEEILSFLSPQWLMTLFVYAVPDETVLRIWDTMFYEGSVALFRAALSIICVYVPLVQDDQAQEALMTMRQEAASIDADLLMHTGHAMLAGIPNEATLHQLREKHRQRLYVEQFHRQDFIEEMQHRKFGMRHLKLVEKQFEEVKASGGNDWAGLSVEEFQSVLSNLGEVDNLFKVFQGTSAVALFDAVNVSGTGKLSRAELVCGFLLVVEGSIEQKLELLFHAFDRRKAGRLTRSEVNRLMATLLNMAYSHEREVGDDVGAGMGNIIEEEEDSDLSGGDEAGRESPQPFAGAGSGAGAGEEERGLTLSPALLGDGDVDLSMWRFLGGRRAPFKIDEASLLRRPVSSPRKPFKSMGSVSSSITEGGEPGGPVMLGQADRSMRMSLRTLRAEHTDSGHGVMQSARLFVKRLFKVCDVKQDGDIDLQTFVAGCLSFPLATQCFDWMGAESATEKQAEAKAAVNFEQEARLQAEAELAQRNAHADRDAEQNITAAITAMGDMTVEVEDIDAAVDDDSDDETPEKWHNKVRKLLPPIRLPGMKSRHTRQASSPASANDLLTRASSGNRRRVMSMGDMERKTSTSSVGSTPRVGTPASAGATMTKVHSADSFRDTPGSAADSPARTPGDSPEAGSTTPPTRRKRRGRTAKSSRQAGCSIM